LPASGGAAGGFSAANSRRTRVRHSEAARGGSPYAEKSPAHTVSHAAASAQQCRIQTAETPADGKGAAMV